jgi:glycosyltransferase involved in cell wall biosynthesis
MPSGRREQSALAPSDGPQPVATVIVPARNAAATLARTLRPLQAMPDGWELIVVDDHSEDDTVAIARAHGARVIVSHGEHSDSCARNAGARVARSDWLVFLDSDVEVSASALVDALQRAQDSGAAATFGVYDRGAHLLGVVERYKNFWIRHTTLSAPRPLKWLNTSVAFVRYEAWETVGGFEERFNARRGGGDLDFGRRLHEAFGPVLLDPQTEVMHHKRFTLRTLLDNDFRRARGWVRLAMHTRGVGGVIAQPRQANVGRRFSWGALATAGGTAAALGAIAVPWLWPLAAAGLATAPLLNADFLWAAARTSVGGWPLFVPLLWLDGLACCAGLGVELGTQLLHKDR